MVVPADVTGAVYGCSGLLAATAAQTRHLVAAALPAAARGDGGRVRHAVPPRLGGGNRLLDCRAGGDSAVVVRAALADRQRTVCSAQRADGLVGGAGVAHCGNPLSAVCRHRLHHPIALRHPSQSLGRLVRTSGVAVVLRIGSCALLRHGGPSRNHRDPPFLGRPAELGADTGIADLHGGTLCLCRQNPIHLELAEGRGRHHGDGFLRNLLVGQDVADADGTATLQVVQPFKWFYDHFSLFVLPLLALFWTGVARRLADYGLTELRYYLLLVGALMTACVLVFLFRTRRGYFALATGALAVVLLTVLVPSLRGEKIAQRAQIQRVRTIAKKLNRLNDDGTLRLPQPDKADTLQVVEHRKLYQSLNYLDNRNDTALFKREFGIARKSDYLASLSERTSGYASAWSEENACKQLEAEEVLIEEMLPSIYLSRKSDEPVNVSGYRQMYGTPNPANADEQLSIGSGRKISANQIFREQLQRLGCSDMLPSRTWIEDHEEELLTYRTDSLLVCFNKLELERTTSDVEWRVEYCEWVVLVK